MLVTVHWHYYPTRISRKIDLVTLIAYLGSESTVIGNMLTLGRLDFVSYIVWIRKDSGIALTIYFFLMVKIAIGSCEFE